MKTELKPEINWVGYIDWTVRDFHGYNTNRGATYNAYLVQDEKTALIDTVKGPYKDKLLANIKALTECEAIDYIVCNHGEPDHSSSLPEIVKALPNATVVCSKKALDSLGAYYDISDWKMQIVATGDTISLGKRTLTFIETPLVHWPDSMMTYVAEEKLLFSMDAFGQHYASNFRFDDECVLSTILEEAKIYYANIVTPYSKRVKQTLDAAGELDIEMIAPSHGVIWRSHLGEILKAYQNWANSEPKAKAVILFDTMWGNTAEMADAIKKGAQTVEDVEIKYISIRHSNLTEIATELLDCATIAFGSSTINRDMLPMAAATLSYVRGLNFSGKKAFAFGASGWSKGAPEALTEGIQSCKWELLGDPIKAKFRGDDDVLKKCFESGKMLAEKALEAASAANYQSLIID